MVEKRVTLIPERLIRSSSFRKDFEEFLSLTDEQINGIATLGESENGFDLSEESIEDAARSLQIDEDRVRTVFDVLDFLYRHALVHEIDQEESARQVCEFAKKLNIKGCETKISAIRRLFARKEAYERKLVTDYAKTAIIPTISSLSVACDIRVVHDLRTEEAIGYIPMAVIAMELEHSESDKRTIQLQLDEEDLDKLLGELGKTKQSLSRIAKEFGSRKA
jgi:hypothetical protein